MSKPYLALYNAAAAGGWAYIFYIAVTSLLSGTPLFPQVSFLLRIVQTAALLEVVHAILGLVPSSFVATLLQVASRLVLLWVYVIGSANDEIRSHWSFTTLVLAWSAVEVPRYLFYLFALFAKDSIPFPLFFLRYNLFLVLYPLGIASELIQIYLNLSILKLTSIPLWYLSLFIFAIYIPGAPFLYSHMLAQRAAATKRRSEGKLPPKPIEGIEYPLDKKGERSSTVLNKGAFEASIREVDPKAADAVKNERNWRFGYTKHVVRNVAISSKSREACLKISAAGLTYLHNNFEFHRGGKAYKLSEAMSKFTDVPFEIGVIKGQKAKPDRYEFDVPYLDKTLKGKELLEQLEKWTKYGTIEPEARDAIAEVVKHSEWLDLSDQYFVLLGAGSAMGPLLVLLALGANVIAIDLDRAPIWKRLLSLARESSGTMIFPIKGKKQSELKTEDELANFAGCNLFTQAPEIRNWLLKVEPEKRLIIGGYAYLDGVLFPKVAIGMDAIIAGVLEKRPDTGLAFLCSPTDVFVTPEAARKAQTANRKNAPLWQKIISAISFGRFLVPNDTAPTVKSSDSGATLPIVEGLVVAQGPNYALAKRLQHWRCMLARESGKSIVSTNIAPSTATRSVVHNKQFAAAYGGMKHFRPMEIMYQETSNAVMGALLIHDIRNPKSVAQPTTKLDNPQQLFASGAFHGGVWRLGFKMNSIGEIAALAYYLKIYKAIVGAVAAGVVGVGAYIATKGAPHTW